MTKAINWELRVVKLADLVPYEKNPRILSERQHSLLSKSLDEFGVSEKPIVNQDMVIIGGHQRTRVLLDKGVKEIEVWYPDRLLTDQEMEKYNILLNSIDADWDYELLANSYEVGDLLDWGFSEDDLGLGKPEKPEKKVKAVISFEFNDKETMLEYITQCERIAEESAAKMKVRG